MLPLGLENFKHSRFRPYNPTDTYLKLDFCDFNCRLFLYS